MQELQKAFNKMRDRWKKIEKTMNLFTEHTSNLFEIEKHFEIFTAELVKFKMEFQRISSKMKTLPESVDHLRQNRNFGNQGEQSHRKFIQNKKGNEILFYFMTQSDT